MSSEIKDNTCNHQCSRCGECCGLFIPFTEKELSTIKEYVKAHNIQRVNRLHGNNFIAKCCFYDDVNKKCLIYEVRPYACRDFRCDHKDWKKRRDHYEKRAKYNSTLSKKMIMGTFDDLIYNDISLFVQVIMNLYKENNYNCEVVIGDLIKILEEINRLDILNSLEVYDEKHNKLSGREMYKIYKKRRHI